MNYYINIFLIYSIFGFIMETTLKYLFFHHMNNGFLYGPWIPIYAFGGLLLSMFCYKYKNKPWLVFLLSILITGILEYGTGFILNTVFHVRLWDYNTEIWNFGNINGYVCLRSVLFFGISSLFLIYILIPIIKKGYYKLSSILFSAIAYSLGLIFLLDMIIYQLINNIF